MDEYLEFWTEWKDVKGKTDKASYWMAMLFHSIIFVVTFPLLVMSFYTPYLIIVGGYCLVAFVPFVSITLRRLNDIEYRWLTLLWLLVPVIGIFIIIVLLLNNTVIVPDEKISKDLLLHEENLAHDLNFNVHDTKHMPNASRGEHKK